MFMESLLSSIVTPLRQIIGLKLAQVNYLCLKGESNENEMDIPLFFHGGEVELKFHSFEKNIRITWIENTNWQERFSVTIKSSKSKEAWEGSFDMFNVSNTQIWRNKIDESLQNIELLGWNKTPQLIKLGFSTGNIYIGTGYQDRFFGDGDDILIGSKETVINFPEMKEAEKYWECNEPLE